MNPVSMKIFDSYAAMTAEQKDAVLGSILLDELYWEDEIKARLNELLTTEQDDALLSRIIEMLGGFLADAEFREKLGAVSGKYPLSYNAVRELMITAFFVNSEKVKSWGTAQLQEKENIDPNNQAGFIRYLNNILKDFNLPLRLRWHAAQALANIGTPDSVNALILFAQALIKRLPENKTDSYYDSGNQFLAEKIAYCIGFAADKICLPEFIDKADDFLIKLHNIIDESLQIEWAIERVKKQKALIRKAVERVRKQKEQLQPKPPLKVADTVKAAAKQIFGSVWIPEGAGQILTAADISAQEKTFMGGIIRIICDFGGEDGDDPAYIWLSWNVKETPENSELRICLVNADTEEIYFKILPGNLKHGEQTFTSDEIGFDPTKTRWAVEIELQDKSE